ncbi:MAG: SusC/RagA family TonB-linked outer membrane protein, partial [Bacteroidota bacterium]
MKLKLTWLLTLCAAFLMHFSFAQERDVTGTVTSSADGLPLPGVNVIVKGTSTGTQTDFDGNYSIKANEGAVLVFSYVGFLTQERTVGASSVVNLALDEDIASLDEVVVVAQSIKREQKALGYAVSTLKAEAITDRPQADVAQILTGQVAGVQVNTGGGFLGTQAVVNIRSKNSISGNNQPLYIVDGAPISGERSFDLDPNNIESTTVLKGLAASTLYGQDGRNGVIIITTKTGSGAQVNKKFEIQASFTTGVLNVINLPEYQNTYGQGADNTINTTFFGNWGARFANQIVPHHLNIPAYADSFPEFQGATDIYRAVPDNVSDFFSTGVSNITSIIASKNFDGGNLSVSFGHTDQTGYLSENTFLRYNFDIGGSFQMANNFDVTANVRYTKTVDRRPSRNFFQLVTWIPRNLDIFRLPFEDPNDGSNVYYRTTINNPRWTRKNTGFNTDADRIFISLGANYTFNDKLSLRYLYSLDNVSEENNDFENKGGVVNDLGFAQTFIDNDRTTTHRISLNGGSYSLASNLNMNFVLGSEIKSFERNDYGIFSTDQVVFGFLNHENFRNNEEIDARGVLTNIVGLYGQLEFDYNKYLYLTLAGRNDWGSTVEEANRSIFYPSAAISFIPTEVFDGLKGSKNNYLKVRGGYGTSANFPNPYLTQPELFASPNAFINPFNNSLVATNALSTFLPNPDLKPELLEEFEVGVEGRLLGNFLDFDISVYKRIVEDQILNSQRA